MGDWTQNPLPTWARIVFVLFWVATAAFCALVEDAGYQESSSAAGEPVPGADALPIPVTVMSAGEPVRDARVFATLVADGGTERAGECATDFKGRCALPAFPPAPQYQLDVEAPWHARGRTTARSGEAVTLEVERAP